MCSFASRTAVRARLRASPAKRSASSASETFCLAATMEDPCLSDLPDERSEVSSSDERRREKKPPEEEFVGEYREVPFVYVSLWRVGERSAERRELRNPDLFLGGGEDGRGSGSLEGWLSQVFRKSGMFIGITRENGRWFWFSWSISFARLYRKATEGRQWNLVEPPR